MADDWFRRKTWTPADREAFFARLRRSRDPFHKAQYLRVQARELQSTGSPDGIAAALELTEVLVRDYPDPTQLAGAYLIRGECLESQGDLRGAVGAYRDAMQTQRNTPNVMSGAHLAFAWLVATEPMPELHREALGVLDEFGEFDSLLPASRYTSSGARALIHSALGDGEVARDWARLALESAEARHSGFRNHPRVGLVENPDRQVRARLEEMATAG